MIRYRIATSDENWAEIHALVTAAYAFMDGRINPPSSLARWTPETFKTAATKGPAFLAVKAGKIIGCAFGHTEGTTLYLGKIAVALTAQNQGIARNLISLADWEATRRNLTKLRLETRIELTENHATFAALGFHKTAETSHPGHNKPTSITMERPLTGTIPPHLIHADKSDKAHQSALKSIITETPELMAALHTLRTLNLPDGWVVSGAIYGAVWNHLTGRAAMYGVKDIDIQYFDPDMSWEAEDREIKRAAPHFPADPPVEVRNQSRVHLWYKNHFGHDYPQLTSTRQAIDLFACTTHAISARLGDKGLELYTPYGLNDVFNFRLHPNTRLPNLKTHEAKAARQTAMWPELSVTPWPES